MAKPETLEELLQRTLGEDFQLLQQRAMGLGFQQQPAPPVNHQSSGQANQNAQYNRKIRAIAAAPYNPPPKGKYAALMEGFTLPKRPNITDWPDLKPGPRVCYSLYTLEKYIQVIALGETVMASLQDKVTQKAICQLLLLAYQLKDAKGVSIFGPIPKELISESREFESITQMILKSVGGGVESFVIKVDPNEPRYEEMVATGYAYWAASTLKMFTKSGENYHQTGSDVGSRFVDFYGYPFPFAGHLLPFESIKTIKQQFDFNQILRNTMYNLVYGGEEVDAGKSLKGFLYVKHLEYTGLHCLVLLFQCVEQMKIDIGRLLALMNAPLFADKIDTIGIVCESLLGNRDKEGWRRQMWRFGRIWDAEFLSALQTKNCAVFTMTIAYLYEMAVPDDASRQSRVMDIAQLKGMKPSLKAIAHSLATDVYHRAMPEGRVPGSGRPGVMHY